jgi:hypothetical protein
VEARAKFAITLINNSNSTLQSLPAAIMKVLFQGVNLMYSAISHGTKMPVIGAGCKVGVNLADLVVKHGRAMGVVPQEEQATGPRSRAGSTHSARSRAGSIGSARSRAGSFVAELNATGINSATGLSNHASSDFQRATAKLNAAGSVAAMKRANAERREACERMERAGASPRASRSPSPRNRPNRVVMASPASAMPL